MPQAESGEPRTTTLLKSIEFLVLAVLCEEPLHGYGMVQRVSERTRGRIEPRPGNLYRVLDRMMHRGWLEPVEHFPDEPADERRTYYRITELGRQVVTAEARWLAEVSTEVLDKAGSRAPLPLGGGA